MSNLQRRRDPALDILRCFALLCVVSFHFFAYVDFYYSSIVGKKMLLMLLLRCVAKMGVPLFLMLSGYLMLNKKAEKGYYTKLIRILVIYVLASICCYGYMMLDAGSPASANNLGEMISMTFNYLAAPHAWYVEMYIGLFLLIPYLNLLYHALGDQKAKARFLALLVFLTALPPLTNSLNYSPETGLRYAPYIYSYQHILPDYWILSYPITLYYTGCYLREFPVKCKRIFQFLATAGSWLLIWAFYAVSNYGASFYYLPWDSDGSIVSMVLAVCIFVTISSTDCRRLPDWAARLFGKMSDLSFGAYLVSWLFESWFHSLLIAAVPSGNARMNYFPIMVLSVYVCSLALSWVLETIYQVSARLLTRRNVS